MSATRFVPGLSSSGVKRLASPRNTPAPANYADWRAHHTVFEDMTALEPRSLNLTEEGGPEKVEAQGATANFFPLLGVKPMLGRSPRVLRLIVSQGMWLVVIGIALGAACALALTRLLTSLLLGVGATDALTFIGVMLMLRANCGAPRGKSLKNPSFLVTNRRTNMLADL